jgi:hypothetical protein
LEDSNATGVNGTQSDNSADASGAAYVFVRSGTTWSQQAYLKASNTGASDKFGYSVAIAGDTVVVGAYLEDSNATGVNGDGSNNSAINSGAAYVFVRSGTTWSQQAYLKASNTGANDLFGFLVAISGDTVVVGAYGEASNATGVNGTQSDNSASSAGAAYVFVLACGSQATGNWNTIATWGCGRVPTTGDNVIIANTHTVTLDVDTADLLNLTINSGGTLQNNGAARTLSLTGNWSNAGTFTPSTFIGVTFKGTGAQTLTGNTTFYNLNVNSGSTLDVGSSVVTVNGTTTNAGTIKRLAPAQAIALSADYTFNDGVGQAMAIINQSAGTAMGNTTVQVNAHTTSAHTCSATTLGGAPVKRYFDITPTNGANVTADITLYYFDDGGANSEANGNTLANIALYHCEGGTWVRLSGGTYSTGTSGNYKWVKLAGHSYTTFSPFAIGGGPGSPTAVTLSQFSAQPGFDLGAWFRQILGLK